MVEINVRGKAQVSVSGNPLDAVADGLGAVTRTLTGGVDRYFNERQRRVDGLLDKTSQGRIVDAAVDAFQLFTAGGAIADGAKAFGLVRNDADKYALSAILNAVLCGPLGAVAAAGDLEDTLQARLPELRRTAKRCRDLGTIPHHAGGRCAGPHEVTRPADRYDARIRIKGYARTPVGGAQIDIGAHVRSSEFNAAIRRHHEHRGLFGPFARDLERIIAGLRHQDESGAHDFRTPEGQGVSNGELRSILEDPNLSFEDKLFLFIMAIAAKQEDKIKELMKRYEQESKQQTGGGTAAKAAGSGASASTLGGIVDGLKDKGPDVIRFGGTAVGIAAPVIGTLVGAGIGTIGFGAGAIPGTMVGGAVGSLVGLAAGFGSNMLADGIQSGAFDKIVPGLGGGSASGGATSRDGSTAGSKTDSGTAGKTPDSDNQAMQILQVEQNKLARMYEMISNMMKSMHDTQMSAIRNLR